MLFFEVVQQKKNIFSNRYINTSFLIAETFKHLIALSNKKEKEFRII